MMLNQGKFFASASGGGGGFLRPSENMSSQKSTIATPFDDLRWPYAISPLRAYLYGVFTVWVIFILYHFVVFAIHAMQKRIVRGNEKKRSQSRQRSKYAQQNHSLCTTESLRPCARVAEIQPKSPVYQPCKASMVKVHRKLSKKISLRLARRKQRKSRREFKTRAKKAPMLPSSPSYELFQHMKSQSLRQLDVDVGGQAAARHSFVQSSIGTNLKEVNYVVGGNCIEPINDEVSNYASAASSREETTISNTKTRVVILISSGLYEYNQKAQQKETLDLFNDLDITYETIDGMDPTQRELRNNLFGISGVRGNYPQIFCSSNDDNHTYLGGYDWVQSMTFEDLKKIAL